MANLYVVDNNLEQLQAQLDEVNRQIDMLNEEPNPDPDSEYVQGLLREKQLLEDTIESLRYEFEELLEEMVKGIRNLEADKDAYKREMEYYRRKKDEADASITKRKAFIRFLMDKRDTKLVKAGNFTLQIKTNGGKTPLLYYVRPENLPAEFRKESVTYKADDEAIRAFLDAGGESECFQYGSRGTNLNIR
jgi:prefoldin subunit 5